MQTLENIAAIWLQEAQEAMGQAVYALQAVGSDEAKQHAKEMRGAIKIARGWERELRRQHKSLGGD